SASFGPSAPIRPTLCGPSRDQLTVTAVDACQQPATASSDICTTTVISNPAVTVTKVCGPASIILGQSYTVSGSVQNTGDTALSNIVVTDKITDAANNVTTITLTTIAGPLAPGATASFGPSAAITPTLCGPSQDQLSVTAVDACQALTG